MERVLDVARVLLAAEMLGGAEACLDLAVQYAGRRTQFDRPIGSFQAVKHACADMMIEIDATRATVMFAAMSAANGDELQTVAPLAKAQTAETLCYAPAPLFRSTVPSPSRGSTTCTCITAGPRPPRRFSGAALEIVRCSPNARGL